MTDILLEYDWHPTRRGFFSYSSAGMSLSMSVRGRWLYSSSLFLLFILINGPNLFYYRNLKDKDSILLLAEKSTMASKMVGKFSMIANAVWPGIA